MAESGSLEAPTTPVSTVSSVQPEIPVAPSNTPRTLLHLNKWAAVATAIILLLITIAGIVMLWSVGFKANDQDSNASKQPANSYNVSNVNVSQQVTDQLLAVTQAAKLSINGELQVGSAFVLTPSDQPSSPKVGQIYYDKNTNTPYVYDGTSFKSMVDLPAVQSLGGATGALTLGNGLELNGGQLTLAAAVQQSIGARVTTIQGQSGNVSLLGGDGIAVNGTTISNTGITNVVGANGLSVVRASGTVTLGLPQLLGATNSPTFASVQLSSALGMSYGGTGLAAGDITGNSVMITNPGGTAYELVPGASGGQCLITDAADNNKIKFGSCTGSLSNGVNGIRDGNNIITDGDVIIRPSASSPLSVVANATSDVIELDVRLTSGGGLTTVTNAGVTSLSLTACAINEVLKSTGNGWICADDEEGTDNDTTYSAGDGLALASGVFSVNLQGIGVGGAGSGLAFNNDGLALQACSAGNVLKYNLTTGWGCDTDSEGTGDGQGVTNVTGSDALSVDLTDSSHAILDVRVQQYRGLTTTANGLGLEACNNDYILKYSTANGGRWLCAADEEGTDTDTTYNEGDGIDITGTVVSVLLQGSASGLEFNNDGELTLAGCDLNEILVSTGSGWACGTDTVGTGDGNTTYTAGDGLTLAGTEFSVNLQGIGVGGAGSGLAFNNDGLALQACSAGNVLKYNLTTGWGCDTDSEGTGDGEGITNITGDDALTVDLSDSSHAILGLKVQADRGLYVDATNGLGLQACTNNKILKYTTANGWICADDEEGTDSNTTYAAGDGLTLTGNEFSINIQGIGVAGAGSGLTFNNDGLALQTCSTNGNVLKYDTTTGWYCDVDSQGTGDGQGVTNVTGSDALSVDLTDSSNAVLDVIVQQYRGLATTANGLGLEACTNDYILKYSTANGGRWLCTPDEEGTDSNTTYSAGDGLGLSGTQFDIVLQGVASSGAAGSGLSFANGGNLSLSNCTTNGQVLKYNTANGWTCDTDTVGGGDGVGIIAATGSGATDGVISKFVGGELADSNLSESGTTDRTLTYAGNLVTNANSGFTGNLLDARLNGVSRLSVTYGGNLTTAGTINTATISGGSLTASAVNGLNVAATSISGDGTGNFTIGAGGTNRNLVLQGSGTGEVQVNSNLNLVTSSTTAFRIQSSGGADTILTADTTNNRLVLGNALGSGANTTALVLDIGTTASRPTGVRGAMYYDGDADVFMCYTLAWGTCSGDGATIASGDGTENVITKFDQNGQLADSKLTDDGSTLGYTGGSLSLQNASNFSILNANDLTSSLQVGQGWSDDTFTKLTDPTLAAAANGVSFSPDGVYMSVATTAYPYITIYKRSGNTFTKLTDPASLPAGAAQDVSWSPDGVYMSVVHATTPFITVYKRSGDTFTKLSNGNLSALPASDAEDVNWSSDGKYMAVVHNGNPYMTVYKRSGDTFTKLADPASVPGSTSYSVAFTPDTNYIAVGMGGSTNLAFYKRTGDTLTRITGFTLPGGTVRGVSWSADSKYLSVAHTDSGGGVFTSMYKRSNDTLTKMTNPADQPTQTSYSATFSANGRYLANTSTSSPRVYVYTHSGDTFTRVTIANPPSAGNGMDTAFSQDGQYMAVALSSAPYISVYRIGSGQAMNVTVNGNLSGGNANLNNLTVNNAATFGATVAIQGDASLAGTLNGLSLSGTSILGSGALSVAAGGTNQDLTLQGSGTGSVQIVGNLNLSSGSQYRIGGVQIASSDLSNDSNLAKLNANNVFTGTTNSFNSAATVQKAMAINVDSLTTGGALEISTSSSTLSSGTLIDVKQASIYASGYSTSNVLFNLERSVGSLDQVATISQIGTVSGGVSTNSANLGQQYLTFNHNVPATGSDRVLFVGIGACAQPGAVTYGGVAMTLYPTTGTNQTGGSCNGSDAGGYGRTFFYYLVNPPTGTNQVATTAGMANSQYAGGVAVTFQNVNQTTPINNAAAGNPATVNVRSYEVGLDVYLGTAGGSYNPVPGGSQSLQGSVQGAGPFRMGVSKTPASASTISQMSWTPINSSIWDHMAIRINPAVIPGTGSATGNVATITNVCSAGICNDTSSVLSVNQNVTTATGAALNVQNAGQGYSLQVGGASSLFSGQQNGYNAAAATLLVGRNSSTLRSINAAGAIGASGADYAEWISWSGAKPDPGSVVVYKGSTFIVSSLETAAIVGNDNIDTDNAILVAFSGQLPVKVTGAVNEGDILVSNGDGTAKAVPAGQATLADYANRVGIAWETSTNPGVKKVTAAVGTSAAGMVNAGALQGAGSFATLNVTGNATIDGALTVAGLTTVEDIVVNGHFITAGSQPTNELQSAVGTGAVVTIEGTDTLGTITITTGSAPTAGGVAKVIFSELYGKAPKVVLSASDDNAAGMRFYKGTTSADSFMLNFKDTPSANTTYTFDYFIGE